MGAAGLTVYIVDDDASVRQAIARLVQSAGMRAEVFESVPKLVNRANREGPDCVIADIRMPETSGLELPGLLAREGHGLPVIFVTAYDTEANRAAAKKMKAAGFFHKPVDGQALLDAIAWAVEANGAGGPQQTTSTTASANRGDAT
jgi:FixJ family two-component response regulator